MTESSSPPPVADYVCGLACLLAVVSAAVIAVIAIRSLGRRREAQAAAAWQALLVAAQVNSEAHLCHVQHVYQRARRGAKAVIVWHATGRQQDAWFWSFWPQSGSTLLVAGAVGYGPHNDNPNVLYVAYGNVLFGAPPGAQAAWHRLQQANRKPGR